jgi:hypothetical protein
MTATRLTMLVVLTTADDFDNSGEDVDVNADDDDDLSDSADSVHKVNLLLKQSFSAMY